MTLFTLLLLSSTYLTTMAQAASLTVSLTGGSGTGTVNSSPPNLNCSATSCTGSFTSVSLSAAPSPDSVFSGWGGACGGMENCSLYVAVPTSVTAVFNRKPSAVQVGGSHYGALQEAYDNVAAGGVVRAVALDQPGDLSLTRGIGFTLKGGYDAGFVSNAGNVTRVNGTVNLETGSMVIENVAIGQTVSATPIAPPTNILATPGNGQASLSWDSVPGANSYNVYYSTAAGVTRGSGTRVTGVNANTSLAVTGLTNGTTYYLVATAVGAGGESKESAQIMTTPGSGATSFSQTDLAGQWYFLRFTSGTSPGWMRGTATVAGNGSVTVNTVLDSSNNTTPPPAGTITWTIDSRGVVTQTGANALDAGNHGVMAASKRLIVGNGSSGGSRAIYVCVKLGGTTFSNSDLTGKSFFIHALESGLGNAGNMWLFGNGHTDASNRLTIDHLYEAPDREDLPPPPNFATLSVNSSSGIVSFSPNANNMEGIITPDKRNMFMTLTGSDLTFGTFYSFMVVQMPATSYALSDLAGTWRSHALVTKPAKWGYGTVSINGSGLQTNLEHHDSAGGNTPSSSTVTIFLNPTSGKLTTSDSSYDGQLSSDKRMFVFTQTEAGTYSLTIALKQ